MKEAKRINDELRADVPDLSQKISQSVDWSAVKAQNNPEKGKNSQSKKRQIFALAACAVVVAIILPLCVVMLGTGGGNTPARVHAAYDVLIDVNPNIVFTDNHRAKRRERGRHSFFILQKLRRAGRSDRGALGCNRIAEVRSYHCGQYSAHIGIRA